MRNDRVPGDHRGGSGARRHGQPRRASSALSPIRGVGLLLALVTALALVGCDGTDGEDSTEPEAESEEAEQTTEAAGSDPDEAGAADGLAPAGEVAPGDVPSEVELDALDGLPVLSGLAWSMWAIGPEGPRSPPTSKLL